MVRTARTTELRARRPRCYEERVEAATPSDTDYRNLTFAAASSTSSPTMPLFVSTTGQSRDNAP